MDWGTEEETVTAEVFGDPNLFAAFRDKLVRAYVLDSVTWEKAEAMVPVALAGQSGQILSSLGYTDDRQVQRQFPFELSGGAEAVAPLARAPSAGFFFNDFRDFLATDDPDLVVTEDQVEAGNVDLKHLHRTIYKKKPK